MIQVGSDGPAIGAGATRGGLATETPATKPGNNVKKLVETILEKLEDGGLNGIYAWFAGRPNVIVNRVNKELYAVLLWREGVVLELVVDDSLDVKYVDVHYSQEPIQ
jgi:hypothetical protein